MVRQITRPVRCFPSPARSGPPDEPVHAPPATHGCCARTLETDPEESNRYARLGEGWVRRRTHWIHTSCFEGWPGRRPDRAVDGLYIL